jgi:hypothetical protein
MRKLWDFLHVNGNNDVQDWIDRLSRPERIRLEHKLDYLVSAEFALILRTKALAGPLIGYRHIYKLRVMSSAALRLMLCQGPHDLASEITLLLGAEERDSKYVPRDAPKTADSRRVLLKENPRLRRQRNAFESGTSRPPAP